MRVPIVVCTLLSLCLFGMAAAESDSQAVQEVEITQSPQQPDVEDPPLPPIEDPTPAPDWVASGMAKAKAGDQEGALAEFRTGCDAGQADACSAGGQWILVGEVSTDGGLQDALPLLRKGCELGNANACYNAALLLDEGKGGVKDAPGAAELYGKGCELGDADACAFGAMLWAQGKRGVTKNSPRAVELAQIGCTKASAQACHLLGAILLDGDGVAQDPAAAADAFQVACLQGYKVSCRLEKKARKKIK